MPDEENESGKVVYKSCTNIRIEEGWLKFRGIRVGEQPGNLVNRSLNMSLIEEWFDVDDAESEAEDDFIVTVYFTGDDPEEERPELD